jgi:hypothetical protein
MSEGVKVCATVRATPMKEVHHDVDVLYLALEDSKRRLQRRMTKLLPSAQRGQTNSFSRRNGVACTKVDLKISAHGMLTQRKRAGNQSW